MAVYSTGVYDYDFCKRVFTKLCEVEVYIAIGHQPNWSDGWHNGYVFGLVEVLGYASDEVNQNASDTHQSYMHVLQDIMKDHRVEVLIDAIKVGVPFKLEEIQAVSELAVVTYLAHNISKAIVALQSI